jgi:hypothetical protein
MYFRNSGLGQTPADLINTQSAPAGTSPLSVPMGSAVCQSCYQNGGWPGVLDPSCWITIYEGGCQQISMPQAFLQGAASAPPPTQAQINSQTPEETADQIAAAAQAAAVQAATLAAANEAATSTATPTSFSSLADDLGLPPPDANTPNWLLIGGIAIAVLFTVEVLKR